MKAPAICHVPDCGKPARLYPAGWLCEDHKPGNGGFGRSVKTRLVEIETKQFEKARAK